MLDQEDERSSLWVVAIPQPDPHWCIGRLAGHTIILWAKPPEEPTRSITQHKHTSGRAKIWYLVHTAFECPPPLRDRHPCAAPARSLMARAKAARPGRCSRSPWGSLVAACAQCFRTFLVVLACDLGSSLVDCWTRTSCLPCASVLVLLALLGYLACLVLLPAWVKMPTCAPGC